MVVRRSRSLLRLASVAFVSLAACTGGAELDGTSWQAVQLGTRPTLPDVVSTIAFDDGEVSGSGGCNTYSGTYEAELSSGVYGGGPDTIAITDVGGTEMACAPPVMEQEQRYYDALQAADTYRLAADRLELLADGEVVVAFVRAEG